MANYNFVYMGDTWIAKEPNSKLINYTGEFVFNEALVQARNRKPRFVLHGGDAVFAGNKPSLTYFKNQKVKKIFPSTPFRVTPGNHDSLYRTVNGKTRISFANFKRIIGPLNFVIKAPDLKIVAVNSIQIRKDAQGNDRTVYGLTQKQLNYLSRELATSSARFKLVSTHVPPEEWANTPEMTAIRRKFMQILKKYKVAAVLLSHEHEFRKYKVNNIQFYISGGAGASLNKGQNNHILVGKVRGTKLTFEFVPISWLDNTSFPPKTSDGVMSVRRARLIRRRA